MVVMIVDQVRQVRRTGGPEPLRYAQNQKPGDQHRRDGLPVGIFHKELPVTQPVEAVGCQPSAAFTTAVEAGTGQPGRQGEQDDTDRPPAVIEGKVKAGPGIGINLP